MMKFGIRVKVNTGTGFIFVHGDNFDYSKEMFGMLPLYIGSTCVATFCKKYLSYNEDKTTGEDVCDSLYYNFDYNEAFAETEG